MNRPDWVYASENKRPDEGETVLCDMGKDYEFAVMRYSNGVFFDVNIGEYYNLGNDVKRWFSIGKHYDEQF